MDDARRSMVRGQVVLHEFRLVQDLATQERRAEDAGKRRDHPAHGRDCGLRNTRGHRAGVSALRRHRVKDGDHAGNRAKQAKQRTQRHAGENDRKGAVDALFGLWHQRLADDVGRPRATFAAALPHFGDIAHHVLVFGLEVPDPLEHQRPHQERGDGDQVQDVAALGERVHPMRYSETSATDPLG